MSTKFGWELRPLDGILQRRSGEQHRRYDRRLLDDMSPLKIGYRNFPEVRYR